MGKLTLSPFTTEIMPFRQRYLSPTLYFFYETEETERWSVAYDHTSDLLAISAPADMGTLVNISVVANNIPGFIDNGVLMDIMNRNGVVSVSNRKAVKEILGYIYSIAKESLNRDDVYYYLCKAVGFEPTRCPATMDWDCRLRESIDQMYLMLNRLPHGVVIRDRGRFGVMLATINNNYRCLLFSEAGRPYPQLYVVDLATREPFILRISQQGFIRSKRIRRMNEIKRQLVDAVVGMGDIERINTIMAKTVASDFR